MNNIIDFKKKNDNVIVNTNTKDYLRAKKRNYVRKQQELYFGTHETDGIIEKMIKNVESVHHSEEINNHNVVKIKKEVSKLKKDIKEIKDMLISIGGKL